MSNNLNKLQAIRDWYSRISEHRITALALVGVRWEEYDYWTLGPYFISETKSWTPKPGDDPNKFVDMILDDIARTAPSPAQPAKSS